ncbi:hypothetical protein RJ640_018758, partial [Escallonia rubra]
MEPDSDPESTMEGRDCEEVSDLVNRSGIKRAGDAVGRDFELDSDKIRAKKVRVRVSEASDGISGAVDGEKTVVLTGSRTAGIELLSGSTEEEDRVLTGDHVRGVDGGKGGFGGEGKENAGLLEEVDNASRSVENREPGFGGEEDRGLAGREACADRGFDLNMPALEMEEWRGAICFQSSRIVETVDISSDESENEGEKVVDWTVSRGKGKEIEKELTAECISGFELGLGTMGIDGVAGADSSINGVRRYSREEKGKAKVVESWLSLGYSPAHLDIEPERQELIEPVVSGIKIYDTSHQVDTSQSQRIENLEFAEIPELANTTVVQARVRAGTVRHREFFSRQARRYAQANARGEGHNQESPEQEGKALETNVEVEDWQSPFGTALKMIKEQKSKRGAEQLINWKPSGDRDHNVSIPLVPSLLDLSLKVLAENAEAIVSLDPVPDALKHRLTDMLCDSRKMTAHVLDLIVRGSPTQIRVKDCSWMTEEHFTKAFGSIDTKNLRVLQLDLCGQCVLDVILGKTIAQSANSLPSLGVVSLRGACRLSDIALKALVVSAPALCSINLSQCSLLTYASIDVLADSLGSILRELYIDDCQRIDAKLIIPALKKFQRLEVLSVAGIQTVCDEFISHIVTTHGRNIKDLDLSNCVKLTDNSLKVIGNSCNELCTLNISNLHALTDLGLQYIANGCRAIQTLHLCRNGFSDEAVAAFLEASGEFLKELALNNVIKVGPRTALSLAKCSKNLLSLDLSWCRRMTSEGLGLIVDNCRSLKQLKLFGCTQITDVFLNGHSNSVVRIIGLKLSPILEHVKMLEAGAVLLRYSPLP